MSKINYYYYENLPEKNRFKSISDFEDCMIRGGEVEFIYNKKVFGIFPNLKQTKNSTFQILISQVCIENPEETEMWADTPDEALEYIIDGVKLRDIITKVEVIVRTI